ncbi:cell wall anchor protein, partial [Nocardiopsis tropica]|nr:cell wall anchor protein [Nocardiopsis tropica]
MTTAQLWTLVALGAFHGLHPGMGWLLAVSRGLQEGGRSEVLRSLPAVAAGHAGSVAVAAVAVTVTGSVTASVLFPVVGGSVIVLVGLLMLLSRRHFHWREVRLPLWQVAAWSFLMSSAHGAGLMLMPVLAGRLSHAEGGGHAGHGGTAPDAAAQAAPAGAAPGAPDGGWSLWDATLTGLAATGVHTAAMLFASGVAA